VVMGASLISRARLAVFLFSLASLVVCGGLFFYLQFRGLMRERVWVKDALNITAGVENARHSLSQFESAARMRLLTSPADDSETSESFTRLEDNLTRLRVLVSGNSYQEAQLDEIELQLSKGAALLQGANLGRAGSPQSGALAIAEVDDQLSAIGMEMGNISQRAQQDLARKESQRYSRVWIAKLAALGALLLNIVVVLILALGLRRDFRKSLKVWNSGTQLASLEEQLRHARKMESVGLLAGGIAHDYNNLLMVIASYTKLLSRRMSQSDPVMAEYVNTIQEAVDTAASVTGQLLAFSRQQSLGLETLDLNVVVSNFCKLLPGFIGEKIVMRVVNASMPCLYRGDRGQMEQVVMNLVANARDAMPEGGQLTIEIAELDIAAKSMAKRSDQILPGRYVQLTISDTGCGMDEHTKARIFEPFFTTKDKGKGTGLGLATVHTIVQQNNGFILVNSKPGKGTTVEVYIPAMPISSEVEAVGKLV
jgi:signal transduction histidine kinase